MKDWEQKLDEFLRFNDRRVLCHIHFHDHGSEFYRLLEKVMPDWEKRERKLELALV